MFENKTFEGIHYSRFIASWNKAVGKGHKLYFKEWLKHLVINGKHLDEETISGIYDLATNGKFELEIDAKKWFKENQETIKTKFLNREL